MLKRTSENQYMIIIHKILSFLLLFFSFQINKIVLVAIKLSIFILCPLIQLGVLLFFKPINARIYSNKNCDNSSENQINNNCTEHKNRRKKHRRHKLKRGITGSGSITSSGSGDVVDKTNAGSSSHLQNNNNNENEINGDCCSDNESASEGPTTDDGEEGDEMQEVRTLAVIFFFCT